MILLDIKAFGQANKRALLYTNLVLGVGKKHAQYYDFLLQTISKISTSLSLFVTCYHAMSMD